MKMFQIVLTGLILVIFITGTAFRSFWCDYASEDIVEQKDSKR